MPSAEARACQRHLGNGAWIGDRTPKTSCNGSFWCMICSVMSPKEREMETYTTQPGSYGRHGQGSILFDDALDTA